MVCPYFADALPLPAHQLIMKFPSVFHEYKSEARIEIWGKNSIIKQRNTTKAIINNRKGVGKTNKTEKSEGKPTIEKEKGLCIRNEAEQTE